MKKLILALGVLCLMLSFAAVGEEQQPAVPSAEMMAPELTAEGAVIATGVSNMEPMGVSQTFPNTVGKLYCFARIVGAKNPTEVRFIWYYQQQEVSTVTLPVNSSSWRTWSSKTILPSMTGAWKVEIRDTRENLLTSLSFTVE